MTSASPALTGSQLSSSVPDLSLADAEALALRVFGVEGRAHLLTSERDQNFRLRTANGETRLLKISNPSEPDDIVDLQIACLDHVARAAPKCPVPRVVWTLSGERGDHVVLGDGRRCAVRMLTYLEGVSAKETPRSRAQRIAMGATLAQLDLALGDFRHPASSHDLMWNVARADQLAPLVETIVGDDRRAMVEHFLARFTNEVRPRLAGLRAQVIHNDYHLHNVLVDADDATQVTGIIDFGDLIHAPLVAEVATAASYQLEAADPLAAAGEFVAAYHAILPLEPAEQEVLADLMTTRHLITVLISEWRAARYPENRAYIMRHNPQSWLALERMTALSPDDARDRLLNGIRTGVI